MNYLKYAKHLIVLIVAIAGALYALDSTYLRTAFFQQHERRQIKSDIIDNEKMIWQYEDRLEKNPSDETSKERKRVLEKQNELLRMELEKGGK